jgi:hypothetical protein
MTPSESPRKKRGSPIAAQTIAAARAVHSARRNRANASLRATVDSIQGSGASTLRAIARTLQARGIRTPAGASTWRPVQVSRLLAALRRNEARALRKLEAASR